MYFAKVVSKVSTSDCQKIDIPPLPGQEPQLYQPPLPLLQQLLKSDETTEGVRLSECCCLEIRDRVPLREEERQSRPPPPRFWRRLPYGFPNIVLDQTR